MSYKDFLPEREIDKRYKDGVDKGSMSYLKIPLPLKPKSSVVPVPKDEKPKQILRQEAAKKKLHRR